MLVVSVILRKRQVVVEWDDLLPGQVLHERGAPPLGRPFNGGKSLGISSGDAGSIAQQGLRGVLLRAPARVVQRGAPETVYGVRPSGPRSWVVQQRSKRVFVALGCGEVYGGSAVEVPRERVCAVAHQPQAGLRPAVASGVVQRPAAAPVHPLGERAGPHGSIHVHEVVDVPCEKESERERVNKRTPC